MVGGEENTQNIFLYLLMFQNLSLVTPLLVGVGRMTVPLESVGWLSHLLSWYHYWKYRSLTLIPN